MHLGNVWAALLSWLSCRAAGGKWLVRIEDLDPQRSRPEYARMIMDDLRWLGLPHDEGGLDGDGRYCQSARHQYYCAALNRLSAAGLTYPCYCTRADILATQAPHRSDNRVVYAGTCRGKEPRPGQPAATRLIIPDHEVTFNDGVYGVQALNPAHLAGDIVLQRADGAWAYQLAVVVDDADMDVTEVVRGVDLLPSAATQIVLYRMLGLRPPHFAHVPLLVNDAGQRLSKRDGAMAMDALRLRCTPEQIVGALAYAAGITDRPGLYTPQQLLPLFRLEKIPAVQTIQAPAL